MNSSPYARRRAAAARLAAWGPGSVRPGIIVATGLAAVLALVLALSAGGQQGGVRPAAPPSAAALSAQSALPLAVVRVAAPGATIGVPRSFLGISTEYWTIPVWAKHLALPGRVLSLITPDGPLVLRIGGSSSDQTRWAPTKELPEWVFETTPAWLRQVRSVVARFGVKVILDLNLVTATPTIAVRWARAAEAVLPTESLLGFEIGNEADIYSPASWRKTTAGGSGSTTLLSA